MKVTDIDGNLVDRDLCKKYNKKFYVKGKHCILMSDNKWYRVETGKIVYNHTTSKWIFHSPFVTEGIVAFKDGAPILGHFSHDMFKNVVVHDVKSGMNTLVINEDIIGSNDKYVKAACYDFYVKKSGLTKDYAKKILSKKVTGINPENLEYESENNLKIYGKYHSDNFTGKELKFENRSNGFIYDYLKDITFGIEYETYDGNVGDRNSKINGLIPVKDGSLRRSIKGRNYLPLEYASVVLNGRKGLKTIVKQCELLNDHCKINEKGSTHVHIGNLPVSKEYAVSIYNLTLGIQREIYSLFPKYVEKTSRFKGKDYCNPLADLNFGDNLENNFKKLYVSLTNEEHTFNTFGLNHPFGHKWNIRSRYSILNLNNLVFGEAQTVEWRVHNSTFNADKLVNWIYILNAISKYSIKYQDELSINKHRKVSLRDVIIDTYGNSRLLTKYLLAYIAYRKRIVETYTNNNDFTGKYDIENDNIIDMGFPIKSIVR